MKKGLEIRAYQVECGPKRDLVALELDGRSPAVEFLRKLKKSNAKGFQILEGHMRALGAVDEVTPRHTFKQLDASRQLYEFKVRSGIRLYCCLLGGALVILTNGGTRIHRKSRIKILEKPKA